MMDLANPYEGLKLLLLGVFFGYHLGRYKSRRTKFFQFTNLRFGDLGEHKKIKGI